MSKTRKVPRKLRPSGTKPAIPAAPQTPQDAGAASPALFESREKDAGADADPSVEDPLQDWPELEAEKDEWLLERDSEGNEPPDR